MKKIASFMVDHLRLQRGVYVSRRDIYGGQMITTLDLRLTRPNVEPVMGTAELHTIEHLGATYLRSHREFSHKTVYFGPMGCRTGFYLLLAGNYSSQEILPLIVSLFEFIRDYKGDIPGASAKDCGNYLDQDLPAAKRRAKEYLDETLYITKEENLIYP